MKNTLSIFNNLRPLTVGFDDMFDHFEHMMDDRFFTNGTVGNFPPYNIVKTGKHTYNIELALAGFDHDDLSVELEDGVLVITGEKQDADVEYLHKGISTKKFKRTFRLNENVEVKDAKFVNGLLTVNLSLVIPEEKQPLQIEIK